MADPRQDPLIAALNAPSTTNGMTAAQWSRLIAAARAANLLGLLAERAAAAAAPVPLAARRHLEATRQLSERQRRSVRWEVHCLQRALEPLGVPVVLLKGAAYAMADHPVSRGRLFGDIDILVPRESIGDVELKLMLAGWSSARSTSYDQRYYRRWMHELPPMFNRRRGTVLDVHHTILPLTSARHPDPRRIIGEAHALPALPAMRVPCAEHLLIHSIVHLLHDGEIHNGLRDLFDIDGLVRAGCATDGFWEALTHAAHELDVAAPVRFGLHLARCLLGTPVPASTFETLERDNRLGGPSALLEFVYRRALHLGAPDRRSIGSELAALAIYVRAHWLRMPPHLLVCHLAHKALLRLRKDEPALAGRA